MKTYDIVDHYGKHMTTKHINDDNNYIYEDYKMDLSIERFVGIDTIK